MTVCLPFLLWFALPTFTGSQQGGAAIAVQCRTRMLHCFCIPHRCRWGLLAIVYRLLAIVYRWLAIVYRLLAIVYRLLAFVYHLLAIVYRLLAIVYRLLATVYRLLATVYRLPLTLLLLLALTRLLAIVYRLPRCLQVLPLLLHTRVLLTGSPTHMEYGIAFAIDDPCCTRDCLHMLARDLKQ